MSPSPPLPRIAVVIPCYNAEKWIDQAIASVLRQSYGNAILIVVDDGSSDASLERVRAFGDRVRLQTGPNQGACHARNEGTRIAKEEGASYILYLDSDDFMEGEMLAGAAKVAAETGADMVLSHNHLIYFDGRRKERFVYSGRVAPERFFEGWISGRHFAPAAILWKISFVDRIGGWDETLSRAQDTEISLRAMFYDPLIMMNDEGAAIYNDINPGSVSKVVSRSSTECRIRVISGLLRRMPGTPLEPLMPIYLDRLYQITRTAFTMKQIDLGRKGLSELAFFGYRKHPGTLQHRLASRLIGLEAKVRLVGH